MTIVYGPKFLKAAKMLPEVSQKKLAKLLEQIALNPFHPTLHTKRLSGSLAGFLSFRVTREWRVLFQFRDAETIQLMDVAHRRNIYR